MIRKGMTEWRGDGPHGSGSLGTESGALRELPFSFKTRFLGDDGQAVTNPEELLGAAHAACFAMTMAFLLTQAGHPAKRLNVTASVDISKVGEKIGERFAITSIALDLEASVDGLSADQFRSLAETAKTNCPVSRALSATPISLTSRLV
jgi:osmotically inducible protein OsmC